MNSYRGYGFKVRRQRAGTIQLSPPQLRNAELDCLDSHGLRAKHVWSVASAPPSPKYILMGKKQGQPERGNRKRVPSRTPPKLLAEAQANLVSNLR